MLNCIEIISPAKINLTLNIYGKLNNYHLLKSLVVFGGVQDKIYIEKSNKYENVSIGKFSKNILGTNIIDSLIKLYQNKYKKIPNYKITIDKNIPVGAGLGGGSANAASIINFFENEHGMVLSDQEIFKLGADVNICTYSKPMLCSNFGENIDFFVKLPKLYIQIVNPCIPLLTKDVFNAYSFNDKNVKDYQYQEEYGDINTLIEILKYMGNDLLSSAMKCMPVIEELIKFLSKQDGCLYSNISGSGASCFAIFDSEEKMYASDLQFKNSYIEYFSNYSSIN
jgi:4-diphosphocytidyl-2-C-methyl-D-erythritol kinase